MYGEPATPLAEVGEMTATGFATGVGLSGAIALFWRLWHRVRPPRHSA